MPYTVVFDVQPQLSDWTDAHSKIGELASIELLFLTPFSSLIPVEVQCSIISHL